MVLQKTKWNYRMFQILIIIIYISYNIKYNYRAKKFFHSEGFQKHTFFTKLDSCHNIIMKNMHSYL